MMQQKKISFDADRLSVAYASDDKFAEILGVSLVSLLENNRDFADICVYVMDGGVSEERKEMVASICERYGRNAPVWVPAKDICKESGMDVKADRGSILQFSHLMILSVVPDDLARVLYLDCDILIRKSLKPLWQIDLEGNTIGALNDAFSRFYRKNIDLEPTDTMFNAGLFLVDLEKWKERDVEKRLLSFIAKHHGKIQQADQGTMNGVLSHEVKVIPPEFNAVTNFFDFSYAEMIRYRRPPSYYTEAEIESAVRDPAVVHFTTGFLSVRPWVRGCSHPFAGEWLRYKAMTPFADFPLWEDCRPFWKRSACKTPRWLMLPIASLFQVYLRPLKNRLKQKKE